MEAVKRAGRLDRPNVERVLVAAPRIEQPKLANYFNVHTIPCTT